MLAVLAYIAGAALVVIAIIAFMSQPAGARTPSVEATTAAMSLALSFTPLLSGAFMHATAAACIALRDIARNSFR